MDFRAATLPPPAAHMPALFTQPPALPPPPQAGMFLYPGLSSPVKPPSHLLPPNKAPRTTATVPPLHQTPSSVHQAPSAAAAAAAAVAAAATTQSSSFAAALKSLARNAGGTDAKEPTTKPPRDPAAAMSPKRVPLHVPRAPHTDNPPPVVAIAPTPTHQRRDPATACSPGDVIKPEVSSSSHLSPASSSSGGGGGGGFQPYRADDRLLESLYPGYAASALYPSLPRPGAAGGYGSRRPEDRYLESLYPLQPMQHQLYGLEEQLYLERLGLLRPGLGVSGLSSSALSAYSPLLTAARYPPELLHSPLYLSQSLYLQERLKLEEDTRRKLESERERCRDSGSRPVTPPVRDRSPVRPPAPPAPVVPPEHRNGTAQERSPPSDRRSTSGSDRQTSPAAYRPYLASPVSRPTAAAPPLDLSSRSHSGKNGTLPEKKRSHHKKTTVVRPFEDTPPAPTNHMAPPADTPLNLSEKPLSALASPPERAVVASGLGVPSADAADSGVPPIVAAVPRAQHKLPPKPESKVEPKLEPKLEPMDTTSGSPDKQEQKKQGILSSDESDSAAHHKDPVIVSTAEMPSGTPEKQLLTHAGLASHSYRNGTSPPVPAEVTVPAGRAAVTTVAATAADDVYTFTDDPSIGPERRHTSPNSRDSDTAKSERRVSTQPRGASSPEGSRCSEPEASSRLTEALNQMADVPAKHLFLDRLGLRPVSGDGEVTAAAAAEVAAGTTAAGAAGSSGTASGVASSSSNTASSSQQRTTDPRQSAASSSGTSSSTASTSNTNNKNSTANNSSSNGATSSGTEEKSRRHRASPTSRSTKSSRSPPQQPRTTSPAGPPESAARLAAACGPWPGMQAITHMYTVYNKERSAALDQAKRHGERLRAQQARLEESSRTLALRLNRQVACRNLQWQRRDAVQEQLDRLSALVRSLPTRARRKH